MFSVQVTLKLDFKLQEYQSKRHTSSHVFFNYVKRGSMPPPPERWKCYPFIFQIKLLEQFVKWFFKNIRWWLRISVKILWVNAFPSVDSLWSSVHWGIKFEQPSVTIFSRNGRKIGWNWKSMGLEIRILGFSSSSLVTNRTCDLNEVAFSGSLFPTCTEARSPSAWLSPVSLAPRRSPGIPSCPVSVCQCLCWRSRWHGQQSTTFTK